MNVVLMAEAANVHTQRWARALAHRGWGVTVLTIREAAIDGIHVVPIRVPRFGITNPRRWWDRYARHLRAVIRDADADLVHVHFLRDYPLMPPMAGDVPLVVSTWGSDVVPFETDLPDTAEQRDRKVALLRGAAAVTATTSYLADRTAEFGGIDRNSISVIPFGVDVERFAALPPRKTDSPPVVGFIKHLEARYGINELVEAMPAVLQRHPAARFVIIGEGPLGESLIRRSCELGVAGAIEWRGRISNEQVPAALAELDVFAMPSLAEAFGVSAVEAQAAGVPVVFGDVPGAREAVTDGVGGLAVPPGDSNALADTICRLLADGALRAKLGAAGRSMVAERFDFADNVPQMEDVYRRVTSDRLCGAVA